MKKVPSEIKNMINSIVKDIRGFKGVEAVILFGSYARGDFKPISDIDICVVLSPACSQKTKHKVSASANEKIDISFFYDLPIFVRYAVIREGRILYGKPSFIHDLTVDTMSVYLDFRHIIDRNMQRVFA